MQDLYWNDWRPESARPHHIYDGKCQDYKNDHVPTLVHKASSSR